MPIRIIIADDHQLFREGLANLLADSVDIEILAQAENGNEAISKAKELEPDVVLMDIGMPVLDGVEATRKLFDELPSMKVIALSMHANKQYIKGMFEAGASGYLFKNCAYDELIKAIRTVYNGKKYLSDAITEIMIQDYLGKEEDLPQTDSELTERESEILKLIAEGVSVSDISDQLFVSIKTIGTHKQHILEKLNLKSTTDIVKYAIKKGIISLD
jgi:DNA-binding NarL/FixJ family response regulator